MQRSFESSKRICKVFLCFRSIKLNFRDVRSVRSICILIQVVQLNRNLFKRFKVCFILMALKVWRTHFRFSKSRKFMPFKLEHFVLIRQTHKRHIQLCFFVLFLQVLIYIYRYLFSCSLSKGESDRSNWKAVFRPIKFRSISSATTNSIGGRCTCCSVAQIRFGNRIFLYKPSLTGDAPFTVDPKKLFE